MSDLLTMSKSLFESVTMSQTLFITDYESDIVCDYVTDFILGSSKITANGYCSHVIKKHLLL